MSVRENVERLLETVMKAMLLMGYLMKKPVEEGERNPLARRVRKL